MLLAADTADFRRVWKPVGYRNKDRHTGGRTSHKALAMRGIGFARLAKHQSHFRMAPVAALVAMLAYLAR
jgi:hypothetical protein